ncbi:TnsA endonuclease N-terminal domain-containing protein [Fontibacillus sp. BL9]|uniref:TnsA endonuclease N-terminal domain-containing protein n=1 Tax=Fontibacillus sp. BL9 TaxID=3389971 RepID=UPI003977FFBB
MNKRMLPYTPIVMPRNKKYGNNYWKMRGPKVNRNVILYSDLEYDHWVTVETDPTVITYCEQPLEITYVLEGKQRRTIFDMCVLKEDGNEYFIEVKYEKDLLSSSRKYDQTMRQIEAQKEWCRLKGKLHEVRTEKDIRTGPYAIENRIKVLTSISNSMASLSLQDISLCISSKKTSMRDLCNQLGSFNTYDVFLACYRLYYKGEIKADLESTIWNMDMEVWKD